MRTSRQLIHERSFAQRQTDHLDNASADATSEPRKRRAKQMELKTVQIEKPEDLNFILGQSHFIKTVEDIHEAMVTSVPGAKFGLAFCESSGPALVRATGTDADLVELAKRNALALSAGHSFILMLGEGLYPINVLNQIKMVPEVCRVFCATANPVEVIIAETEQGRGILGVVDGVTTKGVETEEDVEKRASFLRMIGYKL
jgi:adenosine/AMP kinase